ncbi:hypothetical protein DIPPA_17212 [Diplonema papillatum]|nr:hypothetical protein DIPPA_17212 [Diplonema papillatum]
MAATADDVINLAPLNCLNTTLTIDVAQTVDRTSTAAPHPHHTPGSEPRTQSWLATPGLCTRPRLLCTPFSNPVPLSPAGKRKKWS